MMNSPSPYFDRATSDSASTMNARSSAVGSFRCSPSTAIGVSHESQSRIVKRKGWVKLAYQGVYSFNSHRSHLAMMHHQLAGSPLRDKCREGRCSLCRSDRKSPHSVAPARLPQKFRISEGCGCCHRTEYRG